MQMRIRQQKSKRTAKHKLDTDIGLRIYWCRRKTHSAEPIEADIDAGL